MIFVRALVTALLCCWGAAAAAAGQFDGQADAYFGWRGLKDRGYWAGTADQYAFGIQGNFGVDTSPINGEVGFNLSYRRHEFPTVTVDDTLWDVGIGALWRPCKRSFLQPYLGAGIAVVVAEEQLDFGTGTTYYDNDSTGGVYAHGGIVAVIARHWNAGVDVRVLHGGRVTLFGDGGGDTSYTQATLRFGYSWGTEPPRPREPRHDRRDSRRDRIRPLPPGPLAPEDDKETGF